MSEAVVELFENTRLIKMIINIDFSKTPKQLHRVNKENIGYHAPMPVKSMRTSHVPIRKRTTNRSREVSFE